MISILQEMIGDFQSDPLQSGIPRHLQYTIVPNKAFICIGVRRAGKSTLLFQIMKQLLAQGIERKNILYLNFFDDRLTPLKQGNLAQITEAYFAMYPEKKGSESVYCFFDEVQEVSGWEPFVERLLRAEKCQVFISGSSAKLLSKELATQMRGRSLSWELFPFSFKEFLDYHRVSYSTMTSRVRFAIQKKFHHYIQKGGFPEVQAHPEALRVKIHQEYYNTIVYRDIVERYDVLHPKAVMDLAYRLLNANASLYTINRLTEYLKSIGHRLSKSFVVDCLEWFEDAYFLFSVKLFDASISKQNANAKKIYCVDHALVRSVVSKILMNDGQMLENLIFVQLRRMGVPIYYYRTHSGKEVDFIWLDSSRNKHLVQVCYSLASEENYQREIKALQEAMSEQGLQHATLVTLQEESLAKEGKHTIHILPAWKYLMQQLKDSQVPYR